MGDGEVIVLVVALDRDRCGLFLGGTGERGGDVGRGLDSLQGRWYLRAVHQISV